VTRIPATFPAYVAEKLDDRVERGVRPFSAGDLPPGGIEVRVDWSSVNYKDALATPADGKVARINPLIPGIDLAGEVIASEDPAISPGDGILAHGYDLGVARHGGYAAFTRLPADYVVPLPAGLSARDAMAIGTAGFTAAMSDGRGIYEAHSPEAIVDLLKGGQGVFAISLDAVWSDLESDVGAAAKPRARRAASGGS